MVKEIQCHSNHLPQLFELKNKQQKNKSRYLNVYFVTFFSSKVVVVTHNTFTQLDIPTQDLPLWLV